MRTIILFLLVGIAAFASAANSRPTPADFLTFYSIVPDDAFNREFGTGFSYETGFSDPATVKGFYRGKPVLTMEHISKVSIETREIQTAPISGLRFVLNDSGARLLQDYLRQPKPMDMVAFIDGHAYATVSLDLARQMAEQRVLFIVLPRPQEPTAYHFLLLLADKLKSATPNK
ncbi:MAG: hypothetical protein AB7Q64_20990 [Verrucomicrobiales bacterium]|nr:hypothetical protein [Akkermansiaceae bacterium]